MATERNLAYWGKIRSYSFHILFLFIIFYVVLVPYDFAVLEYELCPRSLSVRLLFVCFVCLSQGWGSLEYGTPGFPGQVLGGRWKPLHYLLGREIFTDISATCGTVSCYVRNDQAGVAFAGTLQVMQVDIATGDMTLILNETVSIVDGPSQLTWFDLPKNVQDLSNDSVFQLVVKDDSDVIQATNTLLREIPKNIKGLPKDSGLTVVVVANGDTTDDTTTMIKVSSNVPVSLYVTLTTLAHGRFEDNAFALVCDRATLSQQQECSRTLKFYSFVDVDQTKLLQDSLRIEDLATYQ